MKCRKSTVSRETKFIKNGATPKVLLTKDLTNTTYR